MQTNNVEFLNLKVYPTNHSNCFLYTINDVFLFYEWLFGDEQREILKHFPVQVRFINNLASKISLTLDINKIISEFNNHYLYYINTTYFKYSEILDFYLRNDIPVVTLRKNCMVGEIGIEPYPSYTLFFSWSCSNTHTLNIRREYNLCNDICKEDNNLTFYDNYKKKTISFDIKKDEDELIKYFVTLFNLKRDEIKYCK